MKFIMTALFLGTIAHADEMSRDKTQEIIKSVEKFEVECPEFTKHKKISTVNLKNKTSESIDKAEMSKFIAEHLDITIDPKSIHSLDTALNSKVVTQGKATTTTYTFNLKLLEGKKVRCDKSYVSEFTEN